MISNKSNISIMTKRGYMNNMRINKILTNKELADKFIKINSGVKVVDWKPIIGD